MTISDARLAANRRNARRSTGPISDEGKAASRRNALKHGLTASIVATEDPQVLQDRTAAIARAVQPRGSWQTWLCDEVATITLRLDRIKVVDQKLRDATAFRASTVWDDDRRVEVEALGAGLAANPPRVVARLRSTPHGCDWLIERWVNLAQSADSPPNGRSEPWTSDQRRLAYDLLGTPLEARVEPVGGEGSEGEIAREAITELQAHRDRVEETDRVDRSLAEAGLTDDAPGELRRVRRYEAALHKRMLWCLDQVKSGSVDHQPPPDQGRDLKHDPDARSRPSSDPIKPAQAPPLVNPFTPSRANAESSTLAAPGRPRVEAKLQQAEARRASKLRKLERRRA